MKTHVSRPNPNVESANMHVVSPVCGNAYHDSEEPQGLPPALPSLPPNPGPCLLTPLSHACSPHTTSQIRHNPPPPCDTNLNNAFVRSVDNRLFFLGSAARVFLDLVQALQDSFGLGASGRSAGALILLLGPTTTYSFLSATTLTRTFKMLFPSHTTTRQCNRPIHTIYSDSTCQ